MIRATEDSVIGMLKKDSPGQRARERGMDRSPEPHARREARERSSAPRPRDGRRSLRPSHSRQVPGGLLALRRTLRGRRRPPARHCQMRMPPDFGVANCSGSFPNGKATTYSTLTGMGLASASMPHFTCISRPA